MAHHYGVHFAERTGTTTIDDHHRVTGVILRGARFIRGASTIDCSSRRKILHAVGVILHDHLPRLSRRDFGESNVNRRETPDTPYLDRPRLRPRDNGGSRGWLTRRERRNGREFRFLSEARSRAIFRDRAPRVANFFSPYRANTDVRVLFSFFVFNEFTIWRINERRQCVNTRRRARRSKPAGLRRADRRDRSLQSLKEMCFIFRAVCT